VLHLFETKSRASFSFSFSFTRVAVLSPHLPLSAEVSQAYRVAAVTAMTTWVDRRKRMHHLPGDTGWWHF